VFVKNAAKRPVAQSTANSAQGSGE